MSKKYSKKELMSLLKIDDKTFKTNLADGLYSQHGKNRGTYYTLTEKHVSEAINRVRCQPECDNCKCDKKGYAVKDDIVTSTPKRRWWWKFFR